MLDLISAKTRMVSIRELIHASSAPTCPAGRSSFGRSIPAGERGPVCDLGDVSFKCPLYQAWATGDGNQGSIPTREPKKAAGVQITRSWHGEVATRNIDGVRRDGRRSWRRPACMCTVCADDRDKVAGMLTYFRERDDDNFIDVKYMHHCRDPNTGPCLIFLGGIPERPEG